MQAYQHYKAEDFLTDDLFIAWVYNRDAAAAAFWSDWMAQAHPNRAEALLAKDILEALNIPDAAVTEAALADETGQIIRRIRQPTHQKMPVLRRVWYVAAAVVLLLGVSWFVWRIPQKPLALMALLPTAQSGDGVVEQANRTSKPVRVTLPDGSTVRLQPNSRIQHVAGFGQQVRAVVLTGEAFFEVVPNPKVPFLVYARDVVTRVVGTSFTVKAYDENPQVTVAVRTGRVTVYSRKELEQHRNAAKPEVTGVVLTPNQQVVFNAKEEVFRKELVENPVFIAKDAASVSFDFDDVPLAEVFRRIEETYEIDIVYNEQLLQKCTLTASLTGLSLYEQLRLISKSLEGSYEVTDGKVLILATGCGE
ncbi:FecR family protein [Larkinella terrae]|uniref:DUF4974 domain-containing protein n=1 Tax=Larkinella terrae TaxID=2025311 RepID=A0A7K0EE12_9BACT|nr:FecR family protein [Larkinella terrae]MRS60067.1 DUF4974 domain-containing protein [Larkinella terrae]